VRLGCSKVRSAGLADKARFHHIGASMRDEKPGATRPNDNAEFLSRVCAVRSSISFGRSAKMRLGGTELVICH
jgi:hypothetical protein